MSVIEETLPELREPTDDDLPIAHLAERPKDGGRPVEGLCGAPLLGIPAFGDFLVCRECEEILERVRR